MRRSAGHAGLTGPDLCRAGPRHLARGAGRVLLADGGLAPFTHPEIALAGWVQNLAFDLFVGALTIRSDTLAVFAMLLPKGGLTSFAWRCYIGLVIACILAGLRWIGTASHVSPTDLGLATCNLMGLVALLTLPLRRRPR